jgi:hypothetical protein
MFAFVEVAIVAVALAQPSVVTVPALRPLEILPSQEVSRAVFGGTGHEPRSSALISLCFSARIAGASRGAAASGSGQASALPATD